MTLYSLNATPYQLKQVKCTQLYSVQPAVMFCLHSCHDDDVTLVGNIDNQLSESLGRIEEVTEYVKIVRSYALLSLSFLRSLRHVGGESLKPHGWVNASQQKHSDTVFAQPHITTLCMIPCVIFRLTVRRWSDYLS